MMLPFWLKRGITKKSRARRLVGGGGRREYMNWLIGIGWFNMLHKWPVSILSIYICVPFQSLSHSRLIRMPPCLCLCLYRHLEIRRLSLHIRKCAYCDFHAFSSVVSAWQVVNKVSPENRLVFHSLVLKDAQAIECSNYCIVKLSLSTIYELFWIWHMK